MERIKSFKHENSIPALYDYDIFPGVVIDDLDEHYKKEWVKQKKYINKIKNRRRNKNKTDSLISW